MESLLSELGLRAFLYTLEQKDGGWTLTVECGLDGDWQTILLAVDRRALAASLDDPASRAKLREEWKPHLRACSTWPG